MGARLPHRTPTNNELEKLVFFVNFIALPGGFLFSDLQAKRQTYARSNVYVGRKKVEELLRRCFAGKLFGMLYGNSCHERLLSILFFLKSKYEKCF